MPVDSAGNRAQVVMDPNSIIARMNPSRVYELYIGAAARDAYKRVREMLQIPSGSHINRVPLETIQAAIEYLVGFYGAISPRQQAEVAGFDLEDQKLLLSLIVDKGWPIFYPLDNEIEIVDVIKNLEAHYPPVYGPVSYVGVSGTRCTTERPIRIGPLYMMLLDKISDDWAAVSSGKLQHFGVLSQISKSEKYNYPFRNSPVRSIGEQEGKIFVGYCGLQAIAELIDRSNSPFTHKQAVWNLLTHPEPEAIEQLVDRKKIPYGKSKALQLIRHITMCSGWVPVYEPEDI